MKKLFKYPLFMHCVSDVEPICHPGQNGKDLYIHILILSRSLSLNFLGFSFGVDWKALLKPS